MVAPSVLRQKTVRVVFKDVAALLTEVRGPATSEMATCRKAEKTAPKRSVDAAALCHWGSRSVNERKFEVGHIRARSAVIHNVESKGLNVKYRRSSRLILLDEESRLLLFKVEDASVSRPGRPRPSTFWITPGGAIEDGESDEEAARRELWEETGLTAIEIGPLVGICEPALDWAGETVQAHDRFYLVRLPATVVTLDNMSQVEREAYRDHGWWSIEQLRTTAEIIIPYSLTKLVELIVSGNIPKEPIQLPD
jgi:8-oxo-dGTP pyrophosphatase MutT (NUDIX family)